MKTSSSQPISTLQSGFSLLAMFLGFGLAVELLGQEDVRAKENDKTQLSGRDEPVLQAAGDRVTRIEFHGGVVRVQGDAALDVVVTRNGQNVPVVREDAPVADPPVKDNSQNPEVDEAAKRDLLERLIAARQGVFVASMEKEIERLQKSVQLDQDAVEKLIEGATEAIEATMEEWKGPAAEWVESSAQSPNGQRVSIFKTPPERLLIRIHVADLVTPVDQPVWKQKVDAILTPEQKALLNEKEAKELRELDERIADWATGMESMQKQNFDRRLNAVVADIGITLALEEQRMKQLRQLGEKALEAVGNQYREGLVEGIKQKPRKEQEIVVKGGGYSGTTTMNHPKDTNVWKEGLKAILTDGEMMKLARISERRKKLTDEAAREMVMSMVDAELVLSSQQAEVLRPLVGSAAEKVAQMLAQVEQGYYAVDAQTVANLLKGEGLSRFKEVLDPVQIESLNRFLSGQTQTMIQYGRLSKQSAKRPAPTSEEEREVLVSEVLREHYEAVVKHALVSYACEIADVDRSANLSNAEKEELMLLAKGLVQEAAQSIRQNLSSNVRRNLVNLPLEQMPQQVANFGSSFFRNWNPKPSGSPMWQAAIEGMLDGERRKRWLAECDARKARLSSSQTTLVLCQADRTASLTDEQLDQLGAKIEGVLLEHGAALERSKNLIGREWYSYNRTVLMPLAGIPDEELKSILSDKQMEQLKPVMTQPRQFWSQIQRSRGDSNH